MAATFQWQHRATPTGAITHRTLVAQFGDGYVQRAGDGLNTKGAEWPLEFVGQRDVIDDIADFLDSHAGSKTFNWMPPFGAIGTYVAPNGYTVTPNGNDVFTLAVTFRLEVRP